jgi:RNA 2',3'-cyclic 3'-phosphodiesterase
VAVLLPADVRAALATEIERLRAQARGVGWVAPENLHLTLKFLGGVEPDRLERVSTALQTTAVAASPFELTLRGLGAFPSPTRPRVIWAGVHAGGDALGALAARVDAALSRLEFPREDRPFSAHVTLGRVREPSRDPALTVALAAGAARDFGRVPVAQVALMRSDLSPRGARYTALATWALGPSGPD